MEGTVRHRRPARRGAAVFMLAAIGVAAATPARGALLTNGGFDVDADANGTPDGWSHWTYGTTAFAAYQPGTNAYAKDATPFVNAGNYGDWWSSGGGWYQTVPVVAGDTYTASVDSATESWDNVAGELRLIYLDASSTEIGRDLLTLANYEASKPWATYSLTKTAPANTAQLKLEFATWGARGSLLMDNAALVDVTAAAVPEPATLAAAMGGALLARRRRR